VTALASDAAVRACIERALVAIDEDLPDFRDPLFALAGSTFALAYLRSHPDLARPLFVELRKLRPLPLWVRDDVEPALVAKRDVVLDGAVCRVSTGTSVLKPEGRECWLEVDAQVAETTLRGLPGGWGLILDGDLTTLSLPALRKLAPLRAIGAVVTDAQQTADWLRGERFDLVLPRRTEPARANVVEPARFSLDARELGARVLWSVDDVDDLLRTPDAAPSVGVVCNAAAAQACALRLATARRPQLAPR